MFAAAFADDEDFHAVFVLIAACKAAGLTGDICPAMRQPFPRDLWGRSCARQWCVYYFCWLLSSQPVARIIYFIGLNKKADTVPLAPFPKIYWTAMAIAARIDETRLVLSRVDR
jgi:hypothetical protein